MKTYTITVNGTAYEVTVEETGSAAPAAPVKAAAPAPAKAAAPAPKAAPAPAAAQGSKGAVEIAASLPGKVFKIAAEVNASVKAGDPVVILEAMKMEVPVVAPQNGTVASINVAVGQAVEAGTLLATMN